MTRSQLVIVAAITLFGACKYPALPDLPDTTDADIDAMSCTQTTCEASVLRVCGPNGVVTDVETCPLGCFSQTRCAWVDPSNGLGGFLDTAAAQGDVSLPQGTVIDTDTGMVHLGAQMIPVTTDTVAQPGGPMLRVLLARTWTIQDVRVQGTLPVAIVGIGDVQIYGIIDASADAGAGGPGASTCTSSGKGGSPTSGLSQFSGSQFAGLGPWIWSTPGAGGGGFGNDGAKGGFWMQHSPDMTFPGAGGGTQNGTPDLVPLRGGCPGGGVDRTGIPNGRGGAGGGAVQVVSAGGSVTITGTSPSLAGIHVGGGGGRGADTGAPDTSTNLSGSAGGGSGGAILIEAPQVRLLGGSIVVAAGGGGGGWGACTARDGEDAPANTSTASGGACPVQSWGQPPLGGAGAGPAAAQPGMDSDKPAGAGGGGLGRIRINTENATFEGDAATSIRGVLTTGTVTTR